jgi:Protein of unknown function (DUF2917)
MDILPIGRETRLEGNALFRLADGVSQCVEGIEGTIWISQVDDPRDIILTAGESVALESPARALVGAINGTAVVRIYPCSSLARAA